LGTDCWWPRFEGDYTLISLAIYNASHAVPGRSSPVAGILCLGHTSHPSGEGRTEERSTRATYQSIEAATKDLRMEMSPDHITATMAKSTEMVQNLKLPLIKCNANAAG
jgi:hypothetical protein